MTYALALHAVGYALFLTGNSVPVPVSIFLRNFAIVGVYELLIFTVIEFYGFRISTFLLWLPAPITGILCASFAADIWIRIAISIFVLAAFDLVLIHYLLRGRKNNHGRAQYLILVGVLVNLLVMILRGFSLYNGTFQIQTITDASFSQALTYMSGFVSLNLICIGFVFMTKEFSDEKTQMLAMKDKLTGCWNRRKIEEVAHHEILRLRRYDSPLSLIIIDIDHFKKINDSFGHITGDTVLKKIATRIQECIRDTDILGRWGGEEFVVILPSSGLSMTAMVAERIRLCIKESEQEQGVCATVSLGYAACQTTDTWKDWLGRADAALYRAKNEGRDRVKSDLPVIISATGPDPDKHLIRLIWHEDYSTGLAEVDEQHRQLFEEANHLLGLALRKDLTALHGEIRKFIQNFENHIKTEEHCLAQLNWPDLSSHTERHTHLIDRSKRLLERYDQNRLELSELLHFIVFEVTAQHILIEDRKFSPQLSA